MRRHRAENRAVRRRVLQDLHVVIFGGDVALQQHVSVRIDQAGQADLAAEVDDCGAALGLRSVTELIDLFANDAKRDVLLRSVALAVVEGSAANIGDLGRGRLRLGLGESDGDREK